RAVRTSPPLREPAACQPRDRRLDPVLQPPAPAPGAGHEDTRRGLCFSGLTCAETAGSLHNSLTVALERSEVAIVPLSRIRELARALPAFETVLYRVVGREIVRDQTLLYLLGSLNAEGRVAAFLLNLSERYGAMGYSRTTFNL